MGKTIETVRLRLEVLAPRHAALLYDALRDPEIYKFIDQRPASSAAALEEHYARLSKQRSPDGLETWLNWAVIREHDNQHMGTYQATLQTGRCILGYVLASAFWGQGYALEAGQAIVAHLKRECHVTALLAYIDARNTASIKHAKRLGLEFVGHDPGTDDAVYSWQAKEPDPNRPASPPNHAIPGSGR